MRLETITQTIILPGTPDQVYTALMDAGQHSAFTGSEVKMSQKIGGPFNVFDGYCTGKNLELVPGKLIRQLWHFDEEGWTEDHFSTCTFEFSNHPEGTQLYFQQDEVPEVSVDALTKGWQEFYWEPLTEYLSK